MGNNRADRITIEKARIVNGELKDDGKLNEKYAPYVKTTHLYCPPHILSAFQAIVKDSKLPGREYLNPYTGNIEYFPKKAEEFTARHLQLLARNETQNTTGRMKKELYENALTVAQIGLIRGLVKSTVVAGLVTAIATGGYGKDSVVKPIPPERVIVIDQAGLQWQDSRYNTGSMFFYPNDPDAEYTQYQNELYQKTFNKERPPKPPIDSTKIIEVTSWNKMKGKLDLDGVAMAVKKEFLLAFDVGQENLEVGISRGFVEQSIKGNFRYLKAGFGHFAKGLDLTPQDQIKLETARLEGILQAIELIEKIKPEERKIYFGKIKNIQLPYSEMSSQGKGEVDPSLQTLVNKIFNRLKQLEFEVVREDFAGAMDALKPQEGYLNILTNTGDPHAMARNENSRAKDPSSKLTPDKPLEGSSLYQSVDDSIGGNTYGLAGHNVGINPKMGVVYNLLLSARSDEEDKLKDIQDFLTAINNLLTTNVFHHSSSAEMYARVLNLSNDAKDIFKALIEISTRAIEKRDDSNPLMQQIKYSDETATSLHRLISSTDESNIVVHTLKLNEIIKEIHNVNAAKAESMNNLFDNLNIGRDKKPSPDVKTATSKESPKQPSSIDGGTGARSSHSVPETSQPKRSPNHPRPTDPERTRYNHINIIMAKRQGILPTTSQKVMKTLKDIKDWFSNKNAKGPFSNRPK